MDGKRDEQFGYLVTCKDRATGKDYTTFVVLTNSADKAIAQIRRMGFAAARSGLFAVRATRVAILPKK